MVANIDHIVNSAEPRLLTVGELASMIDHSHIHPNHSHADLVNGVEIAKRWQTGRFTTQPFRVREARELLRGTGIQLQTFVGFAHGSDTTETKVTQARQALEDGVDELDMVINISALVSGDLKLVEDDVRAVVDVARPYGVTVKAIIEVFYLNDEQLVQATQCAERAGAAFIKTSTGFNPDTVEHVKHSVEVITKVKKPETIVKASGGCTDIDAVLAYYKAGARRFGAYPTEVILKGYEEKLAAGTTGLE